jgi:hypothetical protein
MFLYLAAKRTLSLYSLVQYTEWYECRRTVKCALTFFLNALFGHCKKKKGQINAPTSCPYSFKVENECL